MIEQWNDLYRTCFSEEIDRICQIYTNRPATGEIRHDLQRELDELCSKWKARLGTLPTVIEGNCGTGILKRFVADFSDPQNILINYEVEEDLTHKARIERIVNEIMAMTGGLLEDGNEPN